MISRDVDRSSCGGTWGALLLQKPSRTEEALLHLQAATESAMFWHSGIEFASRCPVISRRRWELWDEAFAWWRDCMMDVCGANECVGILNGRKLEVHNGND